LIKMIFLIVVVIAVLFFIYQIFSSEPMLSPTHAITRSFDKTTALINEEIIVSLNVDVLEGDRVYSIEEVLPSGAVVVDTRDFSQTGNKLRFIEHQNIIDIVKTYKIKFSSEGTYDFSGTYVFNDETTTSQILGDSQIIIVDCIPTSEVCDNLDNDCDNLIDEGLTRICGSGECQGIESCSAGIWGSCSTNTISCDDGIYCTENTVCNSGVCGGGTNICEEDTNNDKCVSMTEILSYIVNWLNDAEDISQIKVTSAADNWVRGVSSCSV